MGWSAIAVFTRQFLALAGVSLIARRLGPDAYGLMGMAGTVTVFIANFRDLGTTTAIVQRKSVSQALLSTLFWVNAGIGVLAASVLFLGATPAALFFKEPRVAAILQTLSLSFLFASTGLVHNAVLSRSMGFRYLSIVEMVTAIAGYGLTLALAIKGWGVWSLVWSNVAGSAITTALYWWFSGWRPSFVFSAAELRSVSGFSLNLSGFGLLNYFSRNADNVVVGKFLGTGPLGYYQMAYTVMVYPIQNVTSIIAQVLTPALSRIQDDNERFASAYTRICMLIGLITFPMMAGLTVTAEPIVLALLGERWRAMIPLVQILAPVGMLQSIHSTVGQIFIAKGRTDWMLRWGIYSSVVYVASFLAGVPFGVVGVASSYALAYFVLVLIPGFAIPLSLIQLPLRRFAAALAPQLLITAMMAGVAQAVLLLLPRAGITSAWAQLSITVAAGAAAYLVLMLQFRPAVLAHLEEAVGRSNLPGAMLVQRLLRPRTA